MHFALTFVLLVSLAIANGKQIRKRQSVPDCKEALNARCRHWVEDYEDIDDSQQAFLEKINEDGLRTTCANLQGVVNCIHEAVIDGECQVDFWPEESAEPLPKEPFPAESSSEHLPEESAEHIAMFLQVLEQVLEHLCTDDVYVIEELIRCITGEELTAKFESCSRAAETREYKQCPAHEFLDCIGTAITTHCSEALGEQFAFIREALKGILNEEICAVPLRLKSLLYKLR